jgi:hypothetical protein
MRLHCASLAAQHSSIVRTNNAYGALLLALQDGHSLSLSTSLVVPQWVASQVKPPATFERASVSQS